MTFNIFISDEFTTLNDYIRAERSDFHKGAKIKKIKTNWVVYYCRGAEPVKHYPVVISMRWFRADARTDPDNVAQAKKYILDGLVKAGVLRNDGWKDIAEFHDTFILLPANPGVEVTIEEIKNESH